MRNFYPEQDFNQRTVTQIKLALSAKHMISGKAKETEAKEMLGDVFKRLLPEAKMYHFHTQV